ncbi:hypothetical protein E2562_024712 [Oryza meyeriana var. granulata]|uniref:Protein kinase domain-containing protein n=1 Tax=Oryza meyeriana var. granulata TaxID=110450 RepID=A0A6G1D6D5_9ORYZ|nr:hypothetical protein E2562_024712 [Oryza meyeriana var. granulata]
MSNAAPDAYLFDRRRDLPYFHEECEHKIVRYDIKPGNVLLNGGLTPSRFTPKLGGRLGPAREGVNHADTHVSVSACPIFLAFRHT